MNSELTPEGRYSGARQAMWDNTLGYNYVIADKNKKKKMRAQFAKTLGTTPGAIHQKDGRPVCVDWETQVLDERMNTLDCWEITGPVVTPTVPSTFPEKLDRVKKHYRLLQEQEKEQAMNAYASAAMINQAANPDADKISHMIGRLSSIYRTKEKEALNTFGFNDDSAPKSPKELVERIKAGDFKFDDSRHLTQDGDWAKDADDWSHGSPINYIEWRTKPIDRDGYKAWEKKAKALKQEVEDTIRVLTPAEGLVALQRFEGTTIN